MTFSTNQQAYLTTLVGCIRFVVKGDTRGLAPALRLHRRYRKRY